MDSENGSWNDVEYYAAKVCMLKNKFRLKGAPNPEGGIYYSPEISEAEVEWYLPARNGLSGIEDSDYPLADGSAYWSSTAISGEPPRSWSYTPGAGTYAVSDRGSLHRVRCVRRPR